MSILNYVGSFFSAIPFRFLPEQTQKQIIAKRQRGIIEFARTHSKYYAQRIPADWKSIEDIPITTKQDIMQSFNDVITDPAVTHEMVLDYALHQKKADALSRYTVALSSGSTGLPFLAVQDTAFTMSSSVVSFFRSIHAKFPICCISSPSDLSISGGSVHANQDTSVLISKTVFSIDSTLHPGEIGKTLIDRHAKTVVGFTNTILLVAFALLEKGLTSKAAQVLLSGEPVSEAAKRTIQKAFPKAEILCIYGCTEGSSMAQGCKYGHMHINSDLVLLEAVDKDGKPVPYGTPSDQTLLTCYFNHVQPLIRYRLGDRITLHKGCPCGCKDDWVEVEGRANDLLPFPTENSVKYVAPITIDLWMDHFYEDGLKNFREYQLVLHKPDTLEIRLDCFDPSRKEEIFAEVAAGLGKKFEEYGIPDVKFVLSDSLPQATTSTGKRSRIYIAKE